MQLQKAKEALWSYQDPVRAESKRIFFKNCKEDVFLGIRAESVRKVAKSFISLKLHEIGELFQSNVHEERSLATGILCQKFLKANDFEKKEIFDFYIQNRHCIRDWNGVDDSAPYIVGAYLLERERTVLYQLAGSEVIWDRRIAIVATWWFIRNDQYTDTLKLAELLLGDKEDLIHKAVGWMLREVGKREVELLKQFLSIHCQKMPRTALRYAIERFTALERKSYLTRPTQSMVQWKQRRTLI